ncbi:MAG: gliding motility-associated C-terminal domain-containing protein, partial [Flavobacteriaceae bacterium]
VTGVDSTLNGNACGGTITRTWNVSDACGNPAIEVSQIITIQDNTAPDVTSCTLSNTVLECSDSTSNESAANNWDANNIALLQACATDNCDTDLTITSDFDYSNLNTSCGPCGSLSVTYTITDDCGNTSQINAILSFDDITIPDLSDCNVNSLTLECDGDNNETLASQWNDANIAALEACADDLNITVTSNYDYNNFNVSCGLSGNLPVTYTITDDCNNSAYVNVTLTFIDTTNPIFNESLPQNATVECDSIPNLVELTVTDSCDNSVEVNFSEVVTNQDDDCSNNYTITRTWVANDCAGNSIEHVQVINVIDTTAPTFDVSSLPQDVTLECSDDIPALEDAIVTATDNCSNIDDIVVTPSEVITNQDDDCSNNYTITRTWVANDCAGNSVEHVQIITMIDTTAPTFDVSSLPQDVTLECSDDIPALEDAIVTATDNCSNIDDIVITPSEVITNQDDDCSNNYTITRTWVANDCAGNSIEHVQVINVIDTTAPTFDVSSLPLNVTLECSDDIPALEDAIVTATDNCSNVDDIVITPSEVITNQDDDCSNNYTITRTWVANDCAGNSIEHVQVITVVDTTAPTLSSLPSNATVECDSIPDAETISATDNCDNNLTVQFDEQIIADPNGCATNYTINRTWSVTDCAGNTTAHTQVITVEDNSEPVLSGDIPADLTVECDTIPDAAVLSVEDNCGNNIPIAFTETISGNDDECANNYIITRTWTVTDCAGNSTQHVQVITVIDTTAPTFDVSSLPQDVTLECSDDIPALEDAIVTATDNCSNINDIVITPSEVITNQDDDCSNNYTITRTWVANDCAGNSVEHVQVINVIDTMGPTFDVSSLPQDVTLECSDDIPALEDITITATDNCSNVDDIVITPSEVITNQDDDCSNNYTITRTWVANDCAGNSVEHVQVINVIDTTAPTFDVSSLPQDVTLECSDDIPVLENVIVTATDNCSNVDDIVITPSEVITNQDDDCSNNYTITRTWIANDCSGNSIEHVQVINVIDTTAPTFDISTLPQDAVLECNDPIPALEDIIVRATDNCTESKDIIITANEVITHQDDNCSNNYTITRTWAANDCAGNSIEHVQVITVVDTTPPMLSGGDDGSAECTGTDPSLNDEYIAWRDSFANTTATDNCGEATLIITEGEWIEEGCSYSMTVQISATDECGLISETQERTFIISDTTAPEILNDLDDVVFYCNEVPPVQELDIEEECSEATIVFTETTEGSQGLDDYQIIRTWVITDDCGNETIREQILLVEPGCDCLEDKFITKAITPNGDVYNDYFKVEGIDDCGIPSLKIFNRWGALVYQSDNYDSKKGRWRGTSQGGITIGGNNELPTGTYYYIIEIKNRDIKPITGHVYLSTK